MTVFMQPLQSAQMPIIKIKQLLCSPLTALPNHYLMLHRHWRIHILRNQRANNHFLIVLHRFGTNIYVFMLGNWKGIVMKLIIPLLWQQFNILRKVMRQMNFPLTLKATMMIAFPSIRTLKRPPSSQNIFLDRFLTAQLSTGRLKCAMILGFVLVHVQSIPVHGGITIISLFIRIMDAWWFSWPLKNYSDIWEVKVMLLIQPFPSILKH